MLLERINIKECKLVVEELCKGPFDENKVDDDAELLKDAAEVRVF